MKRQMAFALVIGGILLGGTASFADEQNASKAPMHMHKSDMDHRSDKEVATEYKDEASQLRAKAESHRKLAKLYGTRTAAKSAANYANVVAHCEQLAQYYEKAAKEAEGVAAELSK